MKPSIVPAKFQRSNKAPKKKNRIKRIVDFPGKQLSRLWKSY
jgi:hypothetical protein